ARSIALWDGQQWRPVGGGVQTDSIVRALAVLPSGDLIAGGNFVTAGGEWRYYVARWDGRFWLPVGTGFNTAVYAMAPAPSGLIAGGAFDFAGSEPMSKVAEWNGTKWSPMGQGF